jgi:16S rRNA (cytidine1402-2'-O)-methyltransferase
MKERGVLYIVSTPIGNLEDITLRALRILKEVKLIAAEDTRRTRILLRHYHLSTPTTSYFEQNEFKKGPHILNALKGGKDVALVSDAGTPGISDPGFRLINLALEDSIRVTSIPGPSALTSALAISGLSTDRFTFYGFPPRKLNERRVFLASLKKEGKTIILYESPRRTIKTLNDINTILGNVEVVLVRELTKVHEEVIRGTASDIVKAFKERSIKGEITLLIGRIETVDEKPPLLEEIRTLRDSLGLPIKDIVKLIAAERDIPRGVVYKESLKLKDQLC